MIISYLYHYYKYYVEQPPTPWDSTGMAAHGHRRLQVYYSFRTINYHYDHHHLHFFNTVTNHIIVINIITLFFRILITSIISVLCFSLSPSFFPIFGYSYYIIFILLHHVIFFPADVSGPAFIFPILFLHTVHAASSLTDIFSLSFSILISRTLYLLLSSHHSSLPFLMRAFYAPSAKYPSLPPVPSRLSLISAIPPQTAFLLAPFLSLATRHVSLFVSR